MPTDPYAPPQRDPYATQVAPNDPYASSSSPMSSDYKPGRAGVYSHEQLKDLWTKAGGDPHYADIMAHVAYAESAGAIDSNENHKTNYVEKGKTYYPEGLWQISTVHGLKNMFDPMTNAREAVALFKAQGFEPWEASRKGGAGGGWGQYAGQHFDPGESTMKKQPAPKALPPGGMPAVLHSTFHMPVTTQMYEGFLGDVAARMESVIKSVSDFGHARWNELRMTTDEENTQFGRFPDRAGRFPGLPQLPDLRVKPKDAPQVAAAMGPGIALAGLGANYAAEPTRRFSERVQGRLSSVIRQVGEAGDIIPAIADAKLRELATGDHQAFDQLNENIRSPQGATRYLDEVLGPNFMMNSPAAIRWWEKQPGVMEALNGAYAKTPGGLLVQLALGLHADLARLKPGHPYLTGLETTALEFLNPEWYIGGGAGGTASKAVFARLTAARLGGNQVARGIADAAMVGNRFWRMGDTGGATAAENEQYHAMGANFIPKAFSDFPEALTSADKYGGLTPEQQIEVVHVGEHPPHPVDEMGMPVDRDPAIEKLSRKKVNGITHQERADNITAHRKKMEEDLKSVAPESAAGLRTGAYFSHNGAYQMAHDEAPGMGRGGTGSPFDEDRKYPTLMDALANGRQLDPEFLPAASDSVHDIRMGLYTRWSWWLKGLENKAITQGPGKGLMHSFDIDYKAPLDPKAFDEAILNKGAYTGLLTDIGVGRSGYDALQAKAEEYAALHAQEEIAKQGLDESHIPKEFERAKRAYIGRARTLFQYDYPNHIFDGPEFLGADKSLYGKALSRPAVDAAIDIHPSLRRKWGDKGMDFDRWEKENPGKNPDIAIDPKDAEPEPLGSNVLEMVNGAIRQGRVLGAGYHGVWNLTPNALQRLNPKRWGWMATALGVDRFRDIPTQWFDELDETHAVHTGVGGIGGVPTKMLAKVLSVPMDELKTPTGAPDWGARSLKVYSMGSRFSQEIAFHYQERRIAAVLFHFLKEDEKLSPSQAAREVSKLLNDSHNVTTRARSIQTKWGKLGIPNEEALQSWNYFYGWMRRGLRLAARTAIEEPQKIMAPLRGVQTANDLQGDEGSSSGTGLSLRALGNPIDRIPFINSMERKLGWGGIGTDAQGNPRYIDIPSFWSFGSTLVRFMGGMAHPLDEPFKAAYTRGMSSVAPATYLGIGALATGVDVLRGEGHMPSGYDPALWDANAPNTTTKMWQAGQKLVEQYAPVPFTSPTLGLLPFSFSEPNAGTATGKAQYQALKAMRPLLQMANEADNRDLANDIYGQMELIARENPDPQALKAWQNNVAQWSTRLQVYNSYARRSKYAPWF